ncbi:hypothetical protein [Streptomyces sp. NPDC088350]|uniref:hypothetical protein n=1 Tax=Streptomyces sp. NPDC088350 TaxID=3365854 RepID=UPI0037FC2E1A
MIGTPRPQGLGGLLGFTRRAHATGEKPGGRTLAEETRPADRPTTPESDLMVSPWPVLAQQGREQRSAPGRRRHRRRAAR